MLLHIGNNVTVPLGALQFVLNARGMQPETKALIDRARRAHRLRKCQGTPKSYVVVTERGRETIYESILASTTLMKRVREETERKFLLEEAVLSITDA